MTRVQIYLDEQQLYLIKQYANQNNTTISKIIRDSIDKFMLNETSKNNNSLSNIVGMASSTVGFGNIPSDQISQKIDEIVYDK